MKSYGIHKFASRAGLAALLLAAVSFSGCAPQVLPPSGSHPPTLPAQVDIYSKQPSKYELLGIIKMPVTPEMKWDQNGDSTAGFDAMKAQAAAMGANGILLVVDPSQYDAEVGVGYKGTYYLVPFIKQSKTAVAAAIFMINK